MQLTRIADVAGRQIYGTRLANGESFSDTFLATPFPCLLWTHDAAPLQEFRIQLARELTRSDCRYAVCGGTDCERLHDIIDEAIVEDSLATGSEDDRPLVMTTWHAEDSMTDVAEFFIMCTNFEEHHFSKFLVVHLGGAADEHRRLEQEVARTADRAGAL